MPYIGTQPTKVVSRQSANVYRYEATAGQTAFTGADLDNNVLACNPADMIVHMNGLRLESTDYTATSTTVTLTTAATAGDEVTVTSFVTFEVADTYTKTAADDRYVNTTGDTMTGGLIVSAADTNDIIKLSRTGTSAGAGYIYSNQNETFGVHNGAGAYQLMVDSAGRVTMPYQPSFLAYDNSGGSVSRTGIIPCNNTSWNVGNHYNTSTYTFTAPVAGMYQFGWNNYTSNWNENMRRMFLIVNSTIVMQTGSHGNGIPVSMTLKLEANDQVYLSGSTTYPIKYYASYAHNAFTGVLIG